MIALLFALREEAAALSQHPGAVVVVTGVGKVNAAMATQAAIDNHRPRAIIVMGLAGATHDGEAGQVIVVTGAVQYDFDARPLTTARGEIPGVGALQADEGLMHALLAAIPEARAGLVLTGDQIITAREVRDRILDEFPEGACFDMETAAVAQVAHQNGVPWAALRITSDAADETFNLEEVLGARVKAASEVFERTSGRLLDRLPDPPE